MPAMRRRTLLAALPLMSAAPMVRTASASDLLGDDAMDGFDRRIDREFEAFDQELDARFAAMDRAIRNGFQEIEQDLRRTWGDAAKLPSPKSWVGYSKDREQRVIVDYEAGTVTLERQGETDRRRLDRALRQALQANSAELDERDVVGKHVDEQARQAGKSAVAAPEDDGNMGQKTDEDAELGRLVGEDPERDYDTDTLVDADGEKKQVGRVTIPMLPSHTRLSAERVAPVARRFADTYDVDLAIVLAIIKNESAFNPRAQSHVPAFGLMQLVPSSGGRDAYAFVEGKQRAPSPELLFQPNRNVELGTAYFHLLMFRYLKAVRDRTAREYCAIAAYNTGAGNVARAFGHATNVDAAAREINGISPQTVYRRLRRDLPYAETKTYLKRVVEDREDYRDFGRG